MSRRTRAAAALLAASAALLCGAPAADAHGLAGRADLPIPISFFAVGAAIVLVLSFAALGALWSAPRLERIPERRLLPLPLIVDVVLGTLAVLVFGASVYAGLAGTDVERDNLAPTVIFVLFWVGVPFASLLFGDVWRLLSPWRAIGRASGAHRAALRGRRHARAAALPGARRPVAGGGRDLRLRGLRAVLGHRPPARRRSRSSCCSTSSSRSSG